MNRSLESRERDLAYDRRHQSSTTRLIQIIVLTSALLLASPTLAFAHAINSPQASAQVANVVLGSSSGHPPLDNYFVELWRHPQNGQPIFVSQQVTNGTGRVSMYDSAFPTMTVGSYVHYEIGVSKITKGAFEMVTDYHWSVIRQAGASRIENIQADVSKAKMLQPLQQSSTRSSATVSPTTVGDNNCSGFVQWCELDVAEWSNVWTTIGEGTGTGYMTDSFQYGQSSASTVSTEVTTGNGWSASGSTTNQASSTTTWPNLYCCWNYYADTQFYYKENQQYVCDGSFEPDDSGWTDWTGYFCQEYDYVPTNTYSV